MVLCSTACHNTSDETAASTCRLPLLLLSEPERLQRHGSTAITSMQHNAYDLKGGASLTSCIVHSIYLQLPTCHQQNITCRPKPRKPSIGLNTVAFPHGYRIWITDLMMAIGLRRKLSCRSQACNMSHSTHYYRPRSFRGTFLRVTST